MWRGCAGESEGGEMATPSSLALAASGDGYRAAFTAVQWQELEHQALIYKYLVAGLPVPPDLVLPIRRSFEALSARFFHHAPAPLGYCSYYGKKFDHEPGRCRRTDGKKWRCSKDAYPDSKYCERHMHRGRNRSRKPVESQSTPRLLSTRVSGVTAVSSSGTDSGSGSYPSVGNGNFQNLPVHSVINSEVLGFGTNIPKYQVESNQYGISSKNYRYARGIISDMGEHSYSSEASASATSLGMDRNIESTWCLRPTQVQSISFVKPSNDSYLQSNPSKLDMQQTSASIIDTSMTKLKEQHCFIGSEIGSPLPINCEQHSMHPVLDGWPKSIEPWSCPDDESKKAFSMTHLSTSMLMAPSEFMARRNCSPNDD